MIEQTEIFRTGDTLHLRPLTEEGEKALYARTGLYGKDVVLTGDWTAVPEGWSGRVVDTSWDRRGTHVALKAGDSARLLEAGSALRLAVVEVRR